jgi:hypothetical protein
MKTTKNLDHLVQAARDTDATWDDARADRVLTSALDRRESRAARDRFARRAMFAASVVTVLGFVFLRGAHASNSTSAEIQPAATIAAAETLGDAGYARD